MTEDREKSWYVFKQASGQCQIVQLVPDEADSSAAEMASTEQWGPFASQDEAIARRVGLIRSGRCLPA